MNIFLQDQLATHRRGRFLSTLLNTESTEEMPQSGILLMIGKDFQELTNEEKKVLFQWTHSPGRTLLLLPPFNQGRLLDELDWNCDFKEKSAETEDDFVGLLKDEVNHEILGDQGKCDQQYGHQWSNRSVNTRFYKAHSGTGIFAMTCLPLWSISLLGETERCLSWLAGLTQQAGQPTQESESLVENDTFELNAQHYSVMVCAYAWRSGNLDKLQDYLSHQTIPIMQVDAINLTQGIEDLAKAGMLNDDGLTPQGCDVLKSSPFWEYAVQMRKMIL